MDGFIHDSSDKAPHGIEPDLSLPLLDQRPPLEIRISSGVRLVGFLLRPLAGWISKRLQRSRSRRLAEERLRVLMDEVAACRDRSDLIDRLGPPRYALPGEHFRSISRDGTVTRPDRVECYAKDGCQIEIEFRDGKLLGVIGHVQPTAWEIIFGRPWNGVRTESRYVDS